jgi:hypothetical protein
MFLYVKKTSRFCFHFQKPSAAFWLLGEIETLLLTFVFEIKTKA